MVKKFKEIKVDYSDGESATYHSLKEAEEAILETITGCDFAVSVDNIVGIDETGKKVQLYCEWSLKLITIDRLVKNKED